MRFLPFRFLLILLISVVPIGHSYGAPSTNLPANTTTNLPARAGIRPEDLLWSSAQDCLKKEQYKDARPKFSEFARQYRTNALFAEALFYQGLCDMRLGQEVQALSLWDQVLKQEMQTKPKSRAWLLTMEQLTIWYGQESKEEDQKKALKQLLTECPDDPVTVGLYTQAAEAKLKKADFAGAVGLYRAVEKKLTEKDRKNLELAAAMTTKGAGNPRELLTAANESFEKNNMEQAINLYQTFLKENSSSPLTAEAKTHLGWCLYLNKEYDRAENLWKSVVQTAPRKSAWVGMSRWHLVVLNAGPYKKIKEAIELCDLQAKEFPGEFYEEQALFSKAWLFWAQQKWDDAKLAFDDLIKRYPEKANHPPIQKYLRDCQNRKSVAPPPAGGKG